jgi:chromosome segregation ATPase
MSEIESQQLDIQAELYRIREDIETLEEELYRLKRREESFESEFENISDQLDEGDY